MEYINKKQITDIKFNNHKQEKKKTSMLLKLLISSSIMFTGCTNHGKNDDNNNNSASTVFEIIEETDTEKSILYENSLNTIMYYNDNLDCNSTLYVGRTIEDLDKLFHESLDNNNIKDANTYLYCIIYLIMECQLTDALDINIDASNMIFFDINCDNNYLSIIKDIIHKEKKYYLDERNFWEPIHYLKVLSNGEAQYKSNDEYDIEYIYNNVAKKISQKTGKKTGNILTKEKIKLTNK